MQTTAPDRRREWFIWVTTADRTADHAVTDDDMATGIAASRGDYRAVCGTRFYPAALTTAPGPVCLRCAGALEARSLISASDPQVETGRRRRRRKARRRHAR